MQPGLRQLGHIQVPDTHSASAVLSYATSPHNECLWLPTEEYAYTCSLLMVTASVEGSHPPGTF